MAAGRVRCGNGLLCCRFILNNRIFTKTGSGQTIGNVEGKDVFSGAAVGDWSEVTLLDCLNMATGNYQSSGATDEKRIFFVSHFILKRIIFLAPFYQCAIFILKGSFLPRQARDRHKGRRIKKS